MTDPTRRDRTRPAELIGLSAVIGVGVGIIVYFGTRTFIVALEAAGGAFIVTLVVFAMLLLAISPRRGGGGGDAGGDDEPRPGAH